MSEWLDFDGGKIGSYHFVKCSNCENIGYIDFRFCPRCGARMINATELCDDCVNHDDPIKAQCSVCSMKTSRYIPKRLFDPAPELHRCDGCDYFDIVWFKCKLHGDRFVDDVECGKKL